MITNKKNNESIIKQLTEFMSKTFDSALTLTLEQNETMRGLKTRTTVNSSFEEKGKQLETLFEFIHAWSRNSYFGDFYNYACAMTSTNSSLIKKYWLVHSLNYCVDDKTVLEYKHNYDEDGLTISIIRKKLKPSSEKNHPFYNDSTANSLLDDYQSFNGTVEQAVSALIKPLLVNGFIDRIIKALDVTSELIEVINHHNNNDYHLNRFIQLLEKGMMDDKNNPFELFSVWKLWDEDFVKNRVVPLLKQKELSESQRKSLHYRLYNSYNEALVINNYYDYCLAYSYSVGYYFPELENTLFFYDKKAFEQTLRVILVAVENAPWVFHQKTEVSLYSSKKNRVFNCSRKNLDD